MKTNNQTTTIPPIVTGQGEYARGYMPERSRRALVMVLLVAASWAGVALVWMVWP